MCSDARFPTPGLMLVDCKACKLMKLREAEECPSGHFRDWACSQCKRLWRFDGDTQEWTLVGHDHQPQWSYTTSRASSK